MSNSVPWSDTDAAIIRDMIRHEIEWINQRLTWLVTLQGLLFAALGFAWKDGQTLIPVLSFLGIATSLSIMIPLFGADLTIRRFVEQWDRNKPADYHGPDVVGYRPVSPWMRFLLPWVFLPLSLGLAWVIVLLVK